MRLLILIAISLLSCKAAREPQPHSDPRIVIDTLKTMLVQLSKRRNFKELDNFVRNYTTKNNVINTLESLSGEGHEGVIIYFERFAEVDADTIDQALAEIANSPSDKEVSQQMRNLYTLIYKVQRSYMGLLVDEADQETIVYLVQVGFRQWAETTMTRLEKALHTFASRVHKNYQPQIDLEKSDYLSDDTKQILLMIKKNLQRPEISPV